jgi:hypothetical protein
MFIGATYFFTNNRRGLLPFPTQKAKETRALLKVLPNMVHPGTLAL